MKCHGHNESVSLNLLVIEKLNNQLNRIENETTLKNSHFALLKLFSFSLHRFTDLSKVQNSVKIDTDRKIA